MRKIKFGWVALLCIACSFSLHGCYYSDGVPIIGTNRQGKPAQFFVPQSEFSNQLGMTTSSIQETVVPVLNERSRRKSWNLRVFVFGFGVSINIGFGPFRVGAYPKFKLVFTNTRLSGYP